MMWRLIKHINLNDPYLNLAVEEALNSLYVKQVTMRLWANRDSVIVGRFQDVLNEVNLDYCLKHEIAIVRRHTGGGSVFHDLGNLNITLVIPRYRTHDILEGYCVVARGIMAAMREVGMDVEYVHPNEILVRGRKISGMAAAVTKSSILIHSTLLASSNLTKMARSLKYLKSDVTTVARELGYVISIHDICKELIKAFREVYGATFIEGKLTAEEIELSERLYRTKYLTDRWNFACP